MALVCFNQIEYLAPINATADPVVTPHPPPYDPIFAHHHRAFLGLHDTALHQQRLQHHPDDLIRERFSCSVPDIQLFLDDGEPCIGVTCGDNKALLYINRLCQGSKGPCIKYRGEWLTPNEFQFVSGRETAKDWKRSIRHRGRSLKTLMSKGMLQVHPPVCDCGGCRISSPVNRGRLVEKHTLPLPPTRVPKKELSSVFSSDDTEGCERTRRGPADITEEQQHYTVLRKSHDSDLSVIICNRLAMPAGPPCCGLTSTHSDDILGKRRAYSPNSSSSECPSHSKKPRSVSPKGNSHTPVLELASHMTPEEHYQHMMSALNEHGSYEEQQRLHQLVNNMCVPRHELLRVRQEAMTAVRNPGGMEAHVPPAGSSSSQRRKQGLPQHRDTHFPERERSRPPPLLSPQNAPHIAPHLCPPFLSLQSALCQTPGFGFLQSAQAKMFAHQQEILRKQNLARLEMSAELLRQKELEYLHRQRLLVDPLDLHPGLAVEHPALRSLPETPQGHSLREELGRRRAMLVLHHNNTPLLSLKHQQAAGDTSPKDLQNMKSMRNAGTQEGSSESLEMLGESSWDEETDGFDEDMKGTENPADVGEDESERNEDVHGLSSEVCRGKDVTKANAGGKELGEVSRGLSAPCSSIVPESPTQHLITSGMSKSETKYLPPGTIPALPPTLPFPYISPYFHTGAVGGLLLDGEEAAVAEDISKWSVEEVCSFIRSLAGCEEYTQVFREHVINGEILPLLTEDHLLNNMGLKLGPALKIRSQVARRMGRIFYMTSFPLALPLLPSALRPTDRDPLSAETHPLSTRSTSSPYSTAPPTCRASPKQENGTSAGGCASSKPPS